MMAEHQEWVSPLSQLVRNWLAENPDVNQKGLADSAGTGHDVISKLKLNPRYLPEPEQIKKIADAMGYSRGRCFQAAYDLQEEDLTIKNITAEDERWLALVHRVPKSLVPTARGLLLALLEQERQSPPLQRVAEDQSSYQADSG